MVRSFFIGILFAAAIALAACSNAKPPVGLLRPSQSAATSSALTITSGIHVLANLPMPAGFMPIEGRPPLWLQNGTEIGVTGTIDGHVVILGLSGPEWRTQRIIAAEVGPGAAEPGDIVDAAASPDGMTLATAVAINSEKRLDIVLRDLIASGPGHPITSFDGTYELVSMHWLSNSTIAIVLRPAKQNNSPPEATPPEENGEPPPPPPKPSEGLQLLVVTGAGSVAPVSLPCAMSPLQWSPDGVYAVGMGDQSTPPIIVDRRKSTCTKMRANPPVRVLSWEPQDASAFLYVQPAAGNRTRAVFEHDMKTGADRLIAISSGAASYVGNGPIVAFGNQKLNFKLIQQNPLVAEVAEIAIFDPDKPEIDIKQLGFRTVAPMMAESSMMYVHATDRALIETYEPAVPESIRRLIVYAVRSDSSFQVAFGPAHGLVQASWSPRGHWLAILNGDINGSALLVISPPG